MVSFLGTNKSNSVNLKNKLKQIVKVMVDKTHQVFATNKGCIITSNKFQECKHQHIVHSLQKQCKAFNDNSRKFGSEKLVSIEKDITFPLNFELLQAPENTSSVESFEMPSNFADKEFCVRIQHGFIERANSFPDRVRFLDASRHADVRADLAMAIPIDVQIRRRSSLSNTLLA